jgi:hypothetical protein
LDTPSKIAKHSAGGTRVTRSLSLGFGVLRKNLWLWPLLAALALAVAGLWIRTSIERAMREDMAEELQTLLDTSVAAVELWMNTEQVQAQQVANETEIRRIANELRKVAAGAADDEAALVLTQSELQGELKKALRSILGGGRYAGYALADTNGLILASDRPQLIGIVPPDPYPELIAKCLQDGATVTRPFPSVVMMRDDSGQLRVGLPTMFALAQQRDLTGDVIGVFGLRLRPEDDFARLLGIARPGETGETYAFDKNGLLLSESRFTKDLIRLGLIADQPGARAQLNVLLRDPEVDLTTGKRPAKTRAEQSPTAMVAQAVKGEAGVNVEGNRDYRGVPVVGAWTWLPAYDLGIATEVDVAEAYRLLYILRRVFWSLFGLLAASSVLIFFFSIAMARVQRAAQNAALAAKELGQYQLEDKLGEGGMGVVYRGRHRMLRRPTAIKLLHPDKTTDEAIARFEREVQLTCQLNHPNTIAIYDYGRTAEGIFYYAMEYLDGVNLDSLVQRHGPQPEGRVILILRQICGSLAEAHEIGLVHRDIKPANIVLGRRGGESDVVKVLDFGLVKAVDSTKEANITSAGSVVGTPLYMSPESIERPGEIDNRSDLYAVAAVGYFLLVGAPPFEGKSVVEICMHHARTPPQRPSERLSRPVGSDLEAILLKGLAKRPEDRFSTARDFADALAACASAASWTARQADAWWRTNSPGGIAIESGPATKKVQQEVTVEMTQEVAPS